MQADLSRTTFRPSQAYDRWILQQGRVLLDADWNGQQEAHRYHLEAQAADAIGPSGAPKAEFGGGFLIGVTPDGRDLTISPGRIYAAGILCELHPERVGLAVSGATTVDVDRFHVDGRDFAPGQFVGVVGPSASPPGEQVATLGIAAVDPAKRRLTLSAAPPSGAFALARVTSLGSQPDSFRPAALAAGAGPGRYRVWLDVWKFHATPLHDPSIREVALGGPDTATRSRVVWQVKLDRLGPAGSGDCSAFGPPWSPPGSNPTGLLKAKVAPPKLGDGPCLLPPAAGFLGLENQLYRVEVHQGGLAGGPGVSFKWQRDNGSVLTGISTLGQTLTVRDLGRDDDLGFADNQTVELLDDRTELDGPNAPLRTIASAPVRATRTIELDQAPTGVDPASHPKLRRWDGAGAIVPPSATFDGWVDLEDGIQVAFGAGTYRAGDYWLIPARTVTTEGAGDIEWPRDDDDNPLARPPFGIAHHAAPLGLVDYDGSAFDPKSLSDCRATFPPLTAIAASDISFDDSLCEIPGVKTVQQAIDALCGRDCCQCTITVSPGKVGWEHDLLAIKDGQDAEICFLAGTFPTDTGVTLEGKGAIVVTGVGPASQIVATKTESAITFLKCKSVTVRDLSATTQSLGSGGADGHLNGAITVVNTPDVTIERVRLTCAHGLGKSATCLTVRGDPGAKVSVRVRHSDFLVGKDQVGILLTEVRRAQVEDNTINMLPFALPRDPFARLDDPAFRRQVASVLLSHAQLGTKQAAGSPRNLLLQSGNLGVQFKAPSELAGAFQAILKANPPKNPASPRDLLRHVRGLTESVLAGKALAADARPIREWLDRFLPFDIPTASAGIVVGGRSGDEVRILNNTVARMLRGIHVGLSHNETSKGAPDVAGRVFIEANSVDVVLPFVQVPERHGIFVGSCDTLQLERNYVELSISGQPPNDTTDGVRIFGQLGRMAVIRQNHVVGFPVSIRFAPTNPASKSLNQWLIADNMLPSRPLVTQGPNKAKTIQPNNIS